MERVKFKIHSWDEENSTLLISFASDETANSDPDAYSTYAFQPAFMWPEATTAENVKFAIAQAGKGIVSEIKRQEDLAKNSELKAVYASLEGFVGDYAANSISTDASLLVEWTESSNFVESEEVEL